jgi:hypothetical protein
MSRNSVIFMRTPGEILHKKCVEKARNGNKIAKRILEAHRYSENGSIILEVESEIVDEANEFFREGYKEWQVEFNEKSKCMPLKDKLKGRCKLQSFERKYRTLKSKYG